jgi:hypothetical protein
MPARKRVATELHRFDSDLAGILITNIYCEWTYIKSNVALIFGSQETILANCKHGIQERLMSEILTIPLEPKGECVSRGIFDV